MIFCSFGGRKFDDSPKAIYNEVCSRPEFDEWRLIWAFVDPDKFDIPRGEKIKVDTLAFFKALLYSKVWVSNSGMDRGIELKRKCNIRVETWHGAPLKKICGEENQNGMIGKNQIPTGRLDDETIRCAQSKYDQEIFKRIFNADDSALLLCDLPRNDELTTFNNEKIQNIKQELGLPSDKKVILYAPTYREYLINDSHENYLAPPIHLDKWERELGNDYCVLIRAHYGVTASLQIKDSNFVKNVSNYPSINDLYIISDILISDYSSSFIDYSILDRPMFCFAYDLEEYNEKRGLYVNLSETLPCTIDKDEETLLKHLKEMNVIDSSKQTMQFHQKFAPYAGKASKVVVDEILLRIKK